MAQSQKMQAVGQLAGGIAHDFNNVLTAIIMSSDLLLTNHRPSDPSFADIMNIKQNANRAASLVRQLLAFSRRQTLRPEVLNLTDVMADLRMLLTRLVGTTVDLKIEHGRDLWPVRPTSASSSRWWSISRSMPGTPCREGGNLTLRTRNVTEAESAELTYRDLVPGDYVLVEVEDSGTGMTQEVIEEDLRAVLHDQGSRQGDGPRPVHGLWYHQADGRLDLFRVRARQGDDIPHFPAASLPGTDVARRAQAEGAEGRRPG